MYILELVKPGDCLGYQDRDLAAKFESLLYHLESAFCDANIALNFFLLELSNGPSKITSEQYRQELEERKIIHEQVCQEFGDQTHANYDKIRFEVDRRFKIEKWKNGELPKSHQNRIKFMYARSFLYALDTIEKFLKVLSEEEGRPQLIADLHLQLKSDFPDLTGVRNTSHHLEDRARGLDAQKVPQPIKLKPVNADFIVGSQGDLILDNLHGTKYGCTMANGRYGVVDVSLDSLLKVQSIIQNVFDAFEWVGFRHHLPR